MKLKVRSWKESEKEFRYYDFDIAKHLERASNDLCDLNGWQLFTGLLDKQGKEIYEGDIILTMDNNIETVEYGEDIDGDGYVSAGFRLYGFNEKDIEVIGNVWENKELLKNGEIKR